MAERLLRCAVYTRKSTEDGLDQAFNSLDAQYEACAAYALSQRHEGWVISKERYDDGGFSGGNMERPGLKRLLADVAAGRINVILVYKIDRLTRSLADFAKIVDVLDGAQASFVSITQSFNTTTSMGRLTLNMLLSFAQFEREVTGERIRDKIAASKRKGMWMGGPVPLGYDVLDRKLVVNESEAARVREIMQLYLELPSVSALAQELTQRGYRTKVQQRTSGPHRGGCPFRRGTLYHLLSNRIYIGEMGHKGTYFPGEHPPIVPAELFDAVQAKLKASASGSSRRTRALKPSLLAGLLYDGEGRAMSPSHASKKSKTTRQRYLYYVTRPDRLDGTPAWRVTGPDLDRLICDRLAQLLNDDHMILGLCSELPAPQLRDAMTLARTKAEIIGSGRPSERLEILSAITPRVDLHEDRVELTVDPQRLSTMLGIASLPAPHDPIIMTLPVMKVRRGHQLRLVIPGPEAAPPPGRDDKLIALIAEAHEARQLIMADPTQSLNAIGAAHKRCRTRLGKLAALACMAPDIVTAILEGRQPATLTAKMLARIELPLAWDAQRAVLGFD